MKTLYDSEFQTILFDTRTSILYETWKSETENMDDDMFKAEMKNQLEASRISNPKAVLTDTFQMNYVIAIGMQEWMNEVIFPEFIKAGITKIAILLPEELITQLSVEQTMAEEEGTKFSVQYFSEKGKAVNWLQTK